MGLRSIYKKLNDASQRNERDRLGLRGPAVCALLLADQDLASEESAVLETSVDANSGGFLMGGLFLDSVWYPGPAGIYHMAFLASWASTAGCAAARFIPRSTSGSLGWEVACRLDLDEIAGYAASRLVRLAENEGLYLTAFHEHASEDRTVAAGSGATTFWSAHRVSDL